MGERRYDKEIVKWDMAILLIPVLATVGQEE